MDEPSTTPMAPTRTPWLRLVGLIVVLLGLNLAMVDGLTWVWRSNGGGNNAPISLNLLFFFAMGWKCFSPILPALWLTWGGGSIAWRLPLVLGVVAVGMSIPNTTVMQHWSMADADFQVFLSNLMTFYLAILGLHVVMMPIRGYYGWQFWFHPPLQPHSRGARWTLFDIIGFTAFAAFPIAFARLMEQWSENFEGQSRGALGWLRIVAELALPLLPTVAAMYAWFFSTRSWRWQLAVAPLAFVAVFPLQLGYDQLKYEGRMSLWYSLFLSLGMVAAAFINLGIIRLFGVRKYG